MDETKPRVSSLLIGLCAFLVAGAAAAVDVSVSDGDGLRIGEERIRLFGIGAPELHQQCKRNRSGYACGIEARNALRSLVRTGQLSCEKVDRDRYGRTVARCSVDGKDLGAAMVRAGWAVDYKRYSDGAYAREEREAREAGRGLWAGEFELPAQWRKNIRRGPRHTSCHKFATSRNRPRRIMADFCGLQRGGDLWQKWPFWAVFLP